eukprot:1185943-Prorocentrum_minimum.AAC.1
MTERPHRKSSHLPNSEQYSVSKHPTGLGLSSGAGFRARVPETFKVTTAISSLKEFRQQTKLRACV